MLVLSIIPKSAPATTAAAVPSLVQLTADNAVVSPAFRPTTLYYVASVDESIDTLTIHAIPQDSTTTVDITGNQYLQPGTNVITIVLTSSEQKTQTYTLAVTKAGTISNNNTNLKSLSIRRWTLAPVFSPETTAYATDVNPSIGRLDISAIAENPNARVAIAGNADFKTGSNQVTVTVTSADGSQTKAYSITVNKLAEPPKSLTSPDDQKASADKLNFPLSTKIIAGVAIITIVVVASVFLTQRRRYRH